MPTNHTVESPARTALKNASTPLAPSTSPHPHSEKYPAADPSHWTPERLLLLYIDHNMTIADIAFTINRSIVDTIALLESPEFTALTEIYLAAQAKRLRFRAQCDREIAASTFARLAEHCDKPETARKAAGSIIRMTTTPKAAAPIESSETSPRPHPVHSTPNHNRKHRAHERDAAPQPAEFTINSQEDFNRLIESMRRFATAQDDTVNGQPASSRAAA